MNYACFSMFIARRDQLRTGRGKKGKRYHRIYMIVSAGGMEVRKSGRGEGETGRRIESGGGREWGEGGERQREIERLHVRLISWLFECNVVS